MWPAGGKLIFSAFDRNQSVNALVRTLETAGQQKCAQMMLKLVEAQRVCFLTFLKKLLGGWAGEKEERCVLKKIKKRVRLYKRQDKVLASVP